MLRVKFETGRVEDYSDEDIRKVTSLLWHMYESTGNINYGKAHNIIQVVHNNRGSVQTSNK